MVLLVRSFMLIHHTHYKQRTRRSLAPMHVLMVQGGDWAPSSKSYALDMHLIVTHFDLHHVVWRLTARHRQTLDLRLIATCWCLRLW